MKKGGEDTGGVDGKALSSRFISKPLKDHQNRKGDGFTTARHRTRGGTVNIQPETQFARQRRPEVPANLPGHVPARAVCA